MRSLQVHYTYKTKNAVVADLCIVQSKTTRFTKTQQLNTQAQQDISVVAYNAAAYLKAMRVSVTAQANVNVVYNVTPNLSYSIAV